MNKSPPSHTLIEPNPCGGDCALLDGGCSQPDCSWHRIAHASSELSPNVVIELSEPPPSANNAYFNLRRGGRVRSSRYRAWCINADWEIKIAKPGKIKGEVELSIEVASHVRGDLDGRLKATIDTLVRNGIIDDDRKKFVKAVNAKWSSEVVGVRVTVTGVGE